MTTPTQSTTPAAAYCQNCGRPLTEAEVRNVNGRVFCEPCIAAGMNVPGGAPGFPPAGGAGYVPDPMTGYPAMAHAPSPLVAGLLGMIPGVGAMYNGQFVKGLVHVLIFIALISAASHFGPFGILIAAWFFYQVFDAVQTANAIRMGLPLPDPLGLNNIGAKLGLGHHGPGGWARPPYTPPGQPFTQSPFTPSTAPGEPVPPPSVTATGLVPFAPQPFDTGASAASAETAGMPPPPPGVYPYPAPVPPRKSLPVGAVVLIALGALFLLNTFDVLDLEWIGKSWPLLLIGGGVWLLYRNTRTAPGGPQ